MVQGVSWCKNTCDGASGKHRPHVYQDNWWIFFDKQRNVCNLQISFESMQNRNNFVCLVMSCRGVVFFIKFIPDYPHYFVFLHSEVQKLKSQMATICLMSNCEREGWFQATEKGFNVFWPSCKKLSGKTQKKESKSREKKGSEFVEILQIDCKHLSKWSNISCQLPVKNSIRAQQAFSG